MAPAAEHRYDDQDQWQEPGADSETSFADSSTVSQNTDGQDSGYDEHIETLTERAQASDVPRTLTHSDEALSLDDPQPSEREDVPGDAMLEEYVELDISTIPPMPFGNDSEPDTVISFVTQYKDILADIVATLDSWIKAEPKQKVTCAQCHNVPGPNHKLLKCPIKSKPLCKACLEESINEHIGDFVYRHSPNLLPEETIDTYASKHMKWVYNEVMRLKPDSEDPNWCWCSKDDCWLGQLHDDEASGPRMVCKRCRAGTCFEHKQSWPRGRIGNACDVKHRRYQNQEGEYAPKKKAKANCNGDGG